MARIRSLSGQHRAPLTTAWQMAIGGGDDCPPGDLEWFDATVPGTAAQALTAAGKASAELLATLQQKHIWYRRPITGLTGRMHFAGLAPSADIYVDSNLVHQNKSMFDPAEIDLPPLGGETLYLHFKPVAETASPAPRRQKWRPHLIANPAMRNIRATLLGHMPGWCPEVQPVGPFAPVEWISDAPNRIRHASVFAEIDGSTGYVEIECLIDNAPDVVVAQCWNAHAELQRDDDGMWRGLVEVASPPLWWPHTHGEPHLLPVSLHGDDFECSLGPVGFRDVQLDTGADGDACIIRINGERIFCRGVNWTDDALTTTLPAGFPFDPDINPFDRNVRQLRAMSANMIRIPGVTTRMPPEFFDACDLHGIMVWMDEPFANFDYDFDCLQREFDIEGSLTRYLEDIETSPSLVVVCGGSEMAQQGAMLSLPESVWKSAWYTERLPEIVTAVRPDVITVPNSPWGGELPFQVDKGVSHYYGVGAYMRPLEDARRANVRFASECLAFANLPQPERLKLITTAHPASPEWKAHVVRDLKADWDFEDVRDHYLGLLYGVDPARLKQDDPARYLALSTAVPGEVMEATFAEWRRVGSVTRGGLVWLWQDLKQGFGWGVRDWQGVAKPAYYALQRAFAPLHLGLTDEGVNGLHLHLTHEGRQHDIGTEFKLSLTCYGDDGSVVMDGARDIALPPRTQMKLSSAEMFGIFFDVNYAYRFGPPAHVAVVARLEDTTSGHTVDAFHFPQGRAAAMADPGLSVTCEKDQYGNWWLAMTARCLAQSVHVVLENGTAANDWFHLPPGTTRIRTSCHKQPPRGYVTALNAPQTVHFG